MTDTGAERLVTVNVANLLRDPARGSEQVTQALMGARVHVTETTDNYAHVTTEDRYGGWIAAQHLSPLWDDTDFFPTSIATLFADVYPQAHADGEMLTKLSVGTRVFLAHRPTVGDWVPLLLADQTTGYVHQVCLNMTHEGDIAGPDLLDQKARRAIDLQGLKRQVLTAVGAQAARVAMRFIGTPYLWGGSSAFGLDCSGLTQLAYKLSGVQLLRDADLQWHDKRFTRSDDDLPLSDTDLAAGDLVLFSKSEGRATHVGLALGDGRFVHASGSRGGVYVNSCDTPQYADTFLGAIRMSPDADLAIEAA